ncbi:MAG: UDP-N-acetylglucosamine 2-epimerase (non-hydrolyzing) [Planctomycetes bacterium]|nr:UDP-N-acetylglucosamine 2-epimerase (non-hydrolyzing) [Planctomycetota bacterium]
MSRLLVVLGTRPEAIKLAPVLRELRQRAGAEEVRVLATGQHAELTRRALAAFGLRADLELPALEPGLSLTEATALLLRRVDEILAAAPPRWVLVQGDTTSALAAGLAAFQRGLRLVHVEAGLRSGRLDLPFPEEGHRRVLDDLAELLCAPTERCRENLESEGHPRERIVVTGNTAIDALEWMRQHAPLSGEPACLRGTTASERVVLVTVHRRESWGAPLLSIAAAVRSLARRHARDTRWILPLHPNPAVAGPLRAALGDVDNVQLVEPLDPPELWACLARASFVLTDSGGLQEEAPSFGRPGLGLRECSERSEGLDLRIAELVGTETRAIEAACERLLSDPAELESMRPRSNPYGDGRASERIAAAILARDAHAGEPR